MIPSAGPDVLTRKPIRGRPRVVKWGAIAVLMSLAVWIAAATADAADADPWLGRDKALHFSACSVIAAGGYGATSLATTDWRWRVAGGAALGLAAGGAKEGWDATGAGDPSWRDFTWDVIGTATGLGVAYFVDWLITPGPSRR